MHTHFGVALCPVAMKQMPSPSTMARFFLRIFFWLLLKGLLVIVVPFVESLLKARILRQSARIWPNMFRYAIRLLALRMCVSNAPHIL